MSLNKRKEKARGNHNLSESYLHCPIVFQEPEAVFDPPAWLGHIPFAFWITDVLRPTTFVELGTHTGNSYFAFCQAVKYLGLSTACYAIDTWEGDPHAGFYGEEVFEAVAAYHDLRYAGFSRLIRSTFDDALSHFNNGSIDLIHVDGYHTYDISKHDVECWLPKLSDRGMMLFHDINVRERDFGASRLWEELSVHYPSFRFLHSHGLGVLAVGEDLPDSIKWLVGPFHNTPGEVLKIRTFFSSLGGLVSDRLAKQKKILEVSIRNSEINRLSGEVEVLRTQVDERDGEIGRLSGEVQGLQVQVDERDGEIGRLSGEVQGLQVQLDERDRQLDSFLSSQSWRITEPLRFIGRQWRRVRNAM